MRPQVLYMVVVLICSCSCEYQNSAHYLHSAIKELKAVTRKKNPVPVVLPNREPLEDVGSNAENRVSLTADNKIPQVSLTKGELNAIYQAAAANEGRIISLNLDDSEHTTQTGTTKDTEEEQYYYYYIPLKNLLNNPEKSGSPGSSAISYYSETHHAEPYYYHTKSSTATPKTLYNYHTHNHQVNVKVQQVKPMMMKDKKKALEPLFMAISGFIGMTVMFIITILCLPKFGGLKSRRGDNETSISHIALQVLDGRDCTERFTCELGKTAHAFSLYNNRFTKLLKRIAPKFLGKQIDKVGKYTLKKHRCASIPCKRR